MRTTLKSILSDTLRARKVLTREDTWTIGESYGYIQSTIDRVFRQKNGNCILCIKLNSKGIEAKGDDFVYAYKWNGGETKFKTDYEEKETNTGRNKRNGDITREDKLDKESKDKRADVGKSKKRVDSRKTRKTKVSNETRKRSKTSKICNQ